MIGRTSILGLATAALVAGLPAYSTALPIAPPNTAQVGQVSNIVEVAQKKGGGQSAAKAKPRAAKAAKVSKASKGGKAAAKKTVVKKTVVKRNVVVRRTVIVRPVRVWVRRPYYGTIIAGVALGTILVATAPRIVPVAPAPNLCWFWSDPDQVRGYWDYCVLPPL